MMNVYLTYSLYLHTKFYAALYLGFSASSRLVLLAVDVPRKHIAMKHVMGISFATPGTRQRLGEGYVKFLEWATPSNLHPFSSNFHDPFVS